MPEIRLILCLCDPELCVKLLPGSVDPIEVGKYLVVLQRFAQKRGVGKGQKLFLLTRNRRVSYIGLVSFHEGIDFVYLKTVEFNHHV